MSERPKRLCACRVARRLFAPTREFDDSMMSLVQVGQGEPKERNPKLLPIGDGFGFLLFFGDLP